MPLRQALRSLVQAPGFTALAILVLGLGMAAAVTLFAALHTVLLREPSFPGAQRLHVVEVLVKSPGGRERFAKASTTQEALRSLPEIEAMAVLSSWGQVEAEGTQGRIHTGIYRVSSDMAEVLGWRPHLGAWFGSRDFATGQGCILSHRFWKQHLGGDPSVVGRPILLMKEPVLVVGISRADFEPPVREGREVGVMVPLPPGDARGDALFLARLRPGVSPEALGQRLETACQVVDPTPGIRAHLRVIHNVLAARFDSANLLVFAGAGLMLALASASVAGLFLARAAERAWETNLRLVLGVSGRRLLGQFFLEGLLVALAASGLAFAATVVLSGLLETFLPGGRQMFGLDRAWAHPVVGAFALILGCGLSLLLSLVPFLHSRRLELGRQLSPLQRPRGQGVLVMVQVAVATLLLAGTSLLGRSLLGLVREDLGFRTQGVLQVDLEEVDYRTPKDPSASSREAVASMQRALEALRARPGIQAVGMSQLRLGLQGESLPAGPWRPVGPVAQVSIGDQSAEVLGLKLLEGRTFTREDLLGLRRVCLIDSHAAQALFQGKAVGRQLVSPHRLWQFQLNTQGYGRDVLPPQTLEVVGVVAPIRPQGMLASVSPSILWVPSSLDMLGPMVVRSTLPPAALRRVVEAVLKEHLPTFTAGDVNSLEGFRWRRLLAQRQLLGLVGTLGGLAMLLASLGVGGLTWGGVVSRTREIGIRAALGATPKALLAWALGMGLRWVALGLGAGLAASVGLARLMASLVHGISPRDPLALVWAAWVLATAAFLACLLPALRAARLRPFQALRTE